MRKACKLYTCGRQWISNGEKNWNRTGKDNVSIISPDGPADCCHMTDIARNAEGAYKTAAHWTIHCLQTEIRCISIHLYFISLHWKQKLKVYNATISPHFTLSHTITQQYNTASCTVPVIISTLTTQNGRTQQYHTICVIIIINNSKLYRMAVTESFLRRAGIIMSKQEFIKTTPNR